MIVVDASVIVEVLLRPPDAGALSRRLFDRKETLHAPHLLDVEVTHAIRRRVLRGEVSEDRGSEAIQLLAKFPIRRYPDKLLLRRMWDLRANLTAYDAAYVALAEGIRGVLLTRDQRLANTSGHSARVELI